MNTTPVADIACIATTARECSTLDAPICMRGGEMCPPACVL